MLDPQQDRPPEREIRLADLDGNVAGVVDEFNGWLAELLQRKGSDLHVKVGTPPKFREAGALVPLDRTPLTHFETEAIGNAIGPSDRMERLRTAGEVDFAYSLAGVGRFRANVFRQRGSISAVLRKLRFGGPSFEDMGLPDVIRRLAEGSAASCS
ncbi:MAG: hypothetical protein L0206_05315 [Actinobacteria bacterium]|nr:hypothetical protein [Actinomycetota bacterium]